MSARERASRMAQELGVMLAERDGSHGDWRSNAEKASGMKEHLTSIEDPVLREGADAIAGKLARIASGGEMHVDSWVDVAGYALLAAGHVTMLARDEAVRFTDEEAGR